MDKLLNESTIPQFGKDSFVVKCFKSHVGHITKDGTVEYQNKSKSELPDNIRYQFESEVGVVSKYNITKQSNNLMKNPNVVDALKVGIYATSRNIYNVGEETVHLFSTSDNGYDKELVDVCYDVALYCPRQASHVGNAILDTSICALVTGVATTVGAFYLTNNVLKLVGVRINIGNM
jgi:hypothetical protein